MTYNAAEEPPVNKNAAASVNKKSKTKKPVKKSKAHIGARHAVYGFAASFILQAIILIPILIAHLAGQMSQGMTPSEDEVLASLSQPDLLFWIQIASYATWFGYGIYVSWRLGLNSIIKDFWFKFRLGRDLGLGILLAAGLRAAEILIFFILGDVFKIDLSGADNTQAFLQGDGIWKYLLLIGVVSILGPLSEEFLFRGMLLQGLIRTFRRKTLTPRTWIGEEIQMASPATFNTFIKFKNFLYKHKYVLAVVISSLAFGFMHFQGTETFGHWLVVIETGTIGLIFALVVLRTQRLGLAIFAHMAFNASGVILALTA